MKKRLNKLLVSFFPLAACLLSPHAQAVNGMFFFPVTNNDEDHKTHAQHFLNYRSFFISLSPLVLLHHPFLYTTTKKQQKNEEGKSQASPAEKEERKVIIGFRGRGREKKVFCVPRADVFGPGEEGDDEVYLGKKGRRGKEEEGERNHMLMKLNKWFFPPFFVNNWRLSSCNKIGLLFCFCHCCLHLALRLLPVVVCLHYPMRLWWGEAGTSVVAVGHTYMSVPFVH